MNDAYEHWRQAALTPTYTPLSDSRLVEMYTLTASVGPANGWTGTGGTLAAMVRELMLEREFLLREGK